MTIPNAVASRADGLVGAAAAVLGHYHHCSCAGHYQPAGHFRCSQMTGASFLQEAASRSADDRSDLAAAAAAAAADDNHHLLAVCCLRVHCWPSARREKTRPPLSRRPPAALHVPAIGSRGWITRRRRRRRRRRARRARRLASADKIAGLSGRAISESAPLEGCPEVWLRASRPSCQCTRVRARARAKLRPDSTRSVSIRSAPAAGGGGGARWLLNSRSARVAAGSEWRLERKITVPLERGTDGADMQHLRASGQ